MAAEIPAISLISSQTLEPPEVSSEFTPEAPATDVVGHVLSQENQLATDRNIAAATIDDSVNACLENIKKEGVCFSKVPHFLYLCFLVHDHFQFFCKLQNLNASKISISSSYIPQPITLHQAIDYLCAQLQELIKYCTKYNWPWDRKQDAQKIVAEEISSRLLCVQQNWTSISNRLKEKPQILNDTSVACMYKLDCFVDVLCRKITQSLSTGQLEAFLLETAKESQEGFQTFPIRNFNSFSFGFLIFLVKLSEKYMRYSTDLILENKKIIQRLSTSIPSELNQEISVKLAKVVEQLNPCASVIQQLKALFTSSSEGILAQLSKLQNDTQPRVFYEGHIAQNFCDLIKLFKKLAIGKFYDSFFDQVSALGNLLGMANHSLQEACALCSPHADLQYVKDLESIRNTYDCAFENLNNNLLGQFSHWTSALQIECNRVYNEIWLAIKNAEKCIEIVGDALHLRSGCWDFRLFDFIHIALMEDVHFLMHSDKDAFAPLYNVLRELFKSGITYINLYTFRTANNVAEFSESFKAIVTELDQCVGALKQQMPNMPAVIQDRWARLQKLLGPFLFGFKKQPLVMFAWFASITSERTKLEQSDKQFLLKTIKLYREELLQYDFNDIQIQIQSWCDLARINQMPFYTEILEFLQSELMSQQTLRQNLINAIPAQFTEEDVIRLAETLDDIHTDYEEVLRDLFFRESVVCVREWAKDKSDYLLFSTIPSGFETMLQLQELTPSVQASEPSQKKQQKNIRKTKKSNSKTSNKSKTTPKDIAPQKHFSSPASHFYDFLAFPSDTILCPGYSLQNTLLWKQIITGRDNTKYYGTIIQELSAFNERVFWKNSYAYAVLLYSNLWLEQALKAKLASAFPPSNQKHPLFDNDPFYPETILRSSHHLHSLMPPKEGRVDGFQEHCLMMDKATFAARFPYATKDNWSHALISLFSSTGNAEEIVKNIEKTSISSMSYAFGLWQQLLNLENGKYAPPVFHRKEILTSHTNGPLTQEFIALMRGQNIDQLLYPVRMLDEMLALSQEEKMQLPFVYAILVTTFASLLVDLTATYYQNVNQSQPEEGTLNVFIDLFEKQETVTESMKTHFKQTANILKRATRYLASSLGQHAGWLHKLYELVQTRQILADGWQSDILVRKIQRRYGIPYQKALPYIERDIVALHEKITQDSLERVETARAILIATLKRL